MISATRNIRRQVAHKPSQATTTGRAIMASVYDQLRGEVVLTLIGEGTAQLMELDQPDASDAIWRIVENVTAQAFRLGAALAAAEAGLPHETGQQLARPLPPLETLDVAA